MPPYLRAAHIEPTLAVTFIATSLGLGLGLGLGSVWLTLAVFCGQLAVGWHNDWVDAERDRAAGRKDKPAVTGAVRVAWLPRLALVALLGAGVLSLPLGMSAAAAHLTAVASALAYNARLKAGVLSVAPWALSFGLLPVTVWLASGQSPPWWAVAAGALLGVSAHCTNALPDLVEDGRTGVRGLPHRLGSRGSVALAASAAASAVATVAYGLSPLPPVAQAAVAAFLLLLGGIVVAGLRGRQRLAFRMTLLASAGLVAALLAAGVLNR